MKMLTEDQVNALWRGALHDKFLAEMCERWLDTDGDTRASYDSTIRSHIKGSRLEMVINTMEQPGAAEGSAS